MFKNKTPANAEVIRQEKYYFEINLGWMGRSSTCGDPVYGLAGDSARGDFIQAREHQNGNQPQSCCDGDIGLVLTITDANSQPIEGAKVDVSVDHTDMSGMGMSGLATEQGGGKYAINANFPMTGKWMLTVYVRKDGLDCKEDIEFPVQ